MKKTLLVMLGIAIGIGFWGIGMPAHAATGAALTPRETTLVKTALDAVGLLLNGLQQRITSPEVVANRVAINATLGDLRGTLIGIRGTLAARTAGTAPMPVSIPKPMPIAQPTVPEPSVPIVSAPEVPTLVLDTPSTRQPNKAASVGATFGGGRTAGIIILAVILIAIGAFFFAGQPQARENLARVDDVPLWAAEVKEPELKELESANSEFELASDITDKPDTTPDQIGSSFRPTLD